MELAEFLECLNSGKTVEGGSDVHQFMHGVSQEAQRLTAQINGSYHEPDELRKLFAQLIGKPVDETFTLFPPFYTDCGKTYQLEKTCLLIWDASSRTRAAFISATVRLSAMVWFWRP